jgi:hypothetical protein
MYNTFSKKLGENKVLLGAVLNYSDAPRGAIMTEDGNFYIVTEDEEFYICLETYEIPQ